MSSKPYLTSSPYYGTPLYGNFLDVANLKKLIPLASDTIYTIDHVYNLRPDMLASDLYGDANLWWVFAMRNPNVLKDPLFDFTTGNTIYVPTKASLQSDLGL